MSTTAISVVILIASGLAAVGAIWKVARFIFRVDRALPTLLNIAQQFENNGGSTIKDKIDDLHKGQQILKTTLSEKGIELEKADRFTLKIAEDTRLLAETTGKIINELIKTQVDDLSHIRTYMHESTHDIRNEMQKLVYDQVNGERKFNDFKENVNERFDRLEERLDRIIPLVSRHRESDTNG